MAYRKVNDISLTSVADAIRAKGGTSDALVFPDGFVSAISAIQTGGSGGEAPHAKWNDVTFIDYDGTVLYSYTLAEAQALTELPALPTHDGLVCQGWNWTLEDIKALNRPVAVGAMYITDDDATRLHIRIATTGRMTVPLYISQTVANGVSIDWGDGSTAETLAGTGNVNTSHTYAEPGDYVISLSPNNSCTLSFGTNSYSGCVMGSADVYCNMLQDVFIGKNVTSIGKYAFLICYSLASVTIPNSVTSIGDYAFQACYSLASVTIPNSVTSIDNYAFYDCRALTNITIPNSVTSIDDHAFYNCYALTNITIPNSVKSIDAYAFYNCYALTNITIPNSVTSIGSDAFRSCYSLASVTIPNSVTSIASNILYSCESIASITIPDSVTSIGNGAFQNCYSLASMAIPDSVASIGNSILYRCEGVRYIDFSACTDIPTLSSTSAFSGISSDCQMLIPSALFDAWSTATNWTTYASYMVAV